MQAPFLVTVRASGGEETNVLARAVIDASGTWTRPNPLGASGRPAIGERARRRAHRLRYPGCPRAWRVTGTPGSGCWWLAAAIPRSMSCSIWSTWPMQAPGTVITWAIRRTGDRAQNLFGGGINDALPARGELGARVQRLGGRRSIAVGDRVPDHADRCRRTEGIVVAAAGRACCRRLTRSSPRPGFRPDLELLSELRLGARSRR